MRGGKRPGAGRKPKAVGRPSKFQAAFTAQAFRLALLGQTDKEMADFFGISEATFNRWKQAHSEFREAIRRGKVGADIDVSESLYKSALGNGSVVETKVQTDAEGRTSQTVDTRQIPASVTAQIFWLKNRQPAKWRDRIESQIDLTGGMKSEEELNAMYEGAIRQAMLDKEERQRQRALMGF